MRKSLDFPKRLIQSTNQTRFNRPFINRVLSASITILFIGVFLVLNSTISLSAGEIVVAGEDSWRPSGLFCFRSNTGTNTEIHLVRYDQGRIEPLFAKVIGQTVEATICLTNGVVATSSDGVVRRLNSQGDVLFVGKPKGFEGASAFSGRISDNCIFMTATVYAKAGWLYYLYLIEISGAEPVVKARYDIIQPIKIAVTFEDIVVIGQKDTLRLPLGNQ